MSLINNNSRRIMILQDVKPGNGPIFDALTLLSCFYLL